MNYNSLINWSKKEFADLPWRQNRNLYRTLVSEIMLQQTTVATVRNKYPSFLIRFPTLGDLACATEDEVCIEWKGLGYYRRARNLRLAAISIVEQCQGHFPESREELKKLPGIGDYTASALVSIGMDKPEIAIDANIERVLSRFYGLGDYKGPHLHKNLRTIFENGELFPSQISAREFNESLMDVGRVYCQAKRAECTHCPLSENCIARISGEPSAFPREKLSKTKTEKHTITLVRVICHRPNSKIAGIKRKSDEWLSGQVELPTYVLESSDSAFSRYPKWQGSVPLELMRIKSTITKYTFNNIVVEVGNCDGQAWPLDQKEVNFSSVTLKILRALGLV